MQKCQRPRQRYAAMETFHMAHVLTELHRGYMTGGNHKDWKDHLLAADISGLPTVRNAFVRLEFQDGKRKLPTQSYHGTGRVHLHLEYLSLMWRIFI